MYYQLDLWVLELQTRFGLSDKDICVLMNISKSTFYRIMSGQSVSDKTRKKIFIIYLDFLKQNI